MVLERQLWKHLDEVNHDSFVGVKKSRGNWRIQFAKNVANGFHVGGQVDGLEFGEIVLVRSYLGWTISIQFFIL